MYVCVHMFVCMKATSHNNNDLNNYDVDDEVISSFFVSFFRLFKRCRLSLPLKVKFDVGPNLCVIIMSMIGGCCPT